MQVYLHLLLIPCAKTGFLKQGSLIGIVTGLVVLFVMLLTVTVIDIDCVL